jgi:hypothetical protein
LVSILAVNYTLPKWGKNKYLRYAVADWNFATSLQYASGLPIQVPATAASTSNLLTAFLRSTRAERIPGVPLFLQDINCHCFDPGQAIVLNPAAWRDPGTTYQDANKNPTIYAVDPTTLKANTPISYNGSFSPAAAYYDDYRFRRRPAETFSLGRTFRIKETITFSVRAEFTNALNRSQVPSPFVGVGLGQGNYNTSVGTPATCPSGIKVNNSGFGAIATCGANATIGERSGLLVGRFQF